MKQKTIVTLTMNPAVDISTSVNNVIPEVKLRCDPPERHPGGGGINVSRGIWKLGGSSRAVFMSGGRNGEYIHDYLAGKGMETLPVRIHGNVRENITVLEESNNRQFRFGMPGPVFKESEWSEALDLIGELCSGTDYLVASGSLPLNVPVDFYRRAGAIASKNGTRFVLDTSGEPLGSASMEEIYLIKPNRRELGHILGQEDSSSLSLEELKELAAEILKERPVHALALSLGGDGALLITAGDEIFVPSPAVQAQSKIGAGDCMLAGMVISLARGSTEEDALRFGVAAGAAAVKTPGTELCRREDTEELYEQIKSDITPSP